MATQKEQIKSLVADIQKLLTERNSNRNIDIEVRGHVNGKLYIIWECKHEQVGLGTCITFRKSGNGKEITAYLDGIKDTLTNLL